jgi:hypothetical protein
MASGRFTYALGVGLSGMLALAAYVSNGLGFWGAFPGTTGLPISVSATVLWAICCMWLIRRYRLLGAVALLGAPLERDSFRRNRILR